MQQKLELTDDQIGSFRHAPALIRHIDGSVLYYLFEHCEGEFTDIDMTSDLHERRLEAVVLADREPFDKIGSFIGNPCQNSE